MKTTNLQTRLYFIAVLVMLVGLGGAALIYLTAGNASDSSMVQDFQNSKSYVRDLELYGGKMNVLMDQFHRWFDGLWHGKSLAFTVACITLIISFGFCLIARYLPNMDSDAPGKNNGPPRK